MRAKITVLVLAIIVAVSAVAAGICEKNAEKETAAKYAEIISSTV